MFFLKVCNDFAEIAFFDFDGHFDQKKPPKIGPNPFKIHQKSLLNFDLKFDHFFGRFLMDFDLQKRAQKRGEFSFLSLLERTWAPDPSRMALRSHFECFLDDSGCFLDDFFKILA